MERKLIINSALKLIREGRFLGSPMSEVAYHANLTERTVSYFFQNRDELIAALASHVAENIKVAVGHSQDIARSFHDHFFSVWFSLYRYYRKHPGVPAFVEQSHNFSGLSQKELNEKIFIAPLIGLFESGPEALKERFQAETLASLFHGSIVTAIKLHGNQESIFSDEEIRILPQILWDGVSHRRAVDLPIGNRQPCR